MRLTCDSGNRGKQIALPGVGGPHPISRGLNRLERQTLP